MNHSVFQNEALLRKEAQLGKQSELNETDVMIRADKLGSFAKQSLISTRRLFLFKPVIDPTTGCLQRSTLD